MKPQCQHILQMKILGYQKYNYKATYFGNTSCILQHPEHSQPWPKGKPGHSPKRNRIKNSDLLDTPSLPYGNQTLQRKKDHLVRWFSYSKLPFTSGLSHCYAWPERKESRSRSGLGVYLFLLRHWPNFSVIRGCCTNQPNVCRGWTPLQKPGKPRSRINLQFIENWIWNTLEYNNPWSNVKSGEMWNHPYSGLLSAVCLFLRTRFAPAFGLATTELSKISLDGESFAEGPQNSYGETSAVTEGRARNIPDLGIISQVVSFITII